MKKKISTLLAVCALMLSSGCALYVSENSYAMAARGEYVLRYPGLNASKDTLHADVLKALQDRGWCIESTGNPIKANLIDMRQSAVGSFTVENNSITVDTKGSMVDGNKPYVPKRYVDNVLASVRKYLNQ